jgi:hypothetical protein
MKLIVCLWLVGAQAVHVLLFFRPSLCVTSHWPGAGAVLTRGWHRRVQARTSAGHDLRAGARRTPWIGGDYVSGYWRRGAALSTVPDGGAEGAARSLPHHSGLPAGLCSRGWGSVEADDGADAGFRCIVNRFGIPDLLFDIVLYLYLLQFSESMGGLRPGQP